MISEKTNTSFKKKSCQDINVNLTEQQITDFLSYKKHLRIRQGIFTTCFLLLCLIDQLLGSAPGQVHGILIKCMGLVIAVMILNCDSKSKGESLLYYTPYLLWTVLFLFGAYQKARQTFGPDILDLFGWLTGYGKNPLAGSIELAEWIVLACNIGIYGIVLLRTIINHIICQRIPRVNWPFLICWSAMLIVMYLSANEAVWPICFLFIFGCFYFTEYSREEVLCLVNGMMNGIICAFFLFFVFSSMFRAFDTAGYCGMYVQYEKNALFYLFAHAAFLGKWYQSHRSGASRGRRLLAAFSCCFAAGYAVITTVRIVVYLIILSTLITVLFISLLENKYRILKVFLRFAAVMALSAAMTPCAYWIALYVPYYYTAPLVYSTETYENKVPFHAPVNENRYTEPAEFIEELTGQFFRYEDADKQELKESRRHLQTEALKAYFQELNLTGHTNAESGFWLDWYYAGYARNIFLHMAYTYGIPAGLIFLALCIVTFLFFLIRFRKSKTPDWHFYTCALFLFTALAYGSFERDWSVGQLPFTLFFLSLYPVMHRTVTPKRKNLSIEERNSHS